MNNSYKRRPYDFKRRVVEKINTTRQDLYECEYKWLSLIPDEQLGKRYYNLKKSMHGTIEYTEEILEKMSAPNRNKTPSPETIAKRSASLKVTYNTPEKKAEQSARSLANWSNDEFRKARSDGMKAEWSDETKREARIESLTEAQNRPEVKEKTSICTKKRWEDAEYRKNQSEKHTGLKMPPRSEEHIRKQSEVQLAKWSTEEHQKKMSNAHLNSEKAMESSRKNIKNCHTPAAIEKNKAIQKAKREDPAFEAEYKAAQKEKAKLGAMKRWHPEQYALLINKA